jgi:hypothetical protein
MMKLNRISLIGVLAATTLACGGVARAGTVIASWDFDVADVAELGTAIVSTTDSVNGLVATPHPSNSAAPIYSNGNPGGGLDASADFSAISGLLEVADPTGILTGHNGGGTGLSSLQIDLDINMNTVTGSTWAIVRNGHIDGADPGNAFNLYTQSSGAIGFIVRGSGGFIQGRTVDTGLLDANAGWQHVTATWDGSQVTIAVDGVPQVLNGTTNETFIAGNIGSLTASDANMGIGGLRRSGSPGTVGQFMDGAVDNLVISTDVPEPASVLLLSLGGLALTGRCKR